MTTSYLGLQTNEVQILVILGLYRGFIGIMEKKMETSVYMYIYIYFLGCRV